MKTLAKIVVAVLVIAIAVPVVKYRTVRPCSMLEKERIERIRDSIESAGEDAQEAVAEHSERAERILEDVGDALEGLEPGFRAPEESGSQPLIR